MKKSNFTSKIKLNMGKQNQQIMFASLTWHIFSKLYDLFSICLKNSISFVRDCTFHQIQTNSENHEF